MARNPSTQNLTCTHSPHWHRPGRLPPQHTMLTPQAPELPRGCASAGRRATVALAWQAAEVTRLLRSEAPPFAPAHLRALFNAPPSLYHGIAPPLAPMFAPQCGPACLGFRVYTSHAPPSLYHGIAPPLAPMFAPQCGPACLGFQGLGLVPLENRGSGL